MKIKMLLFVVVAGWLSISSEIVAQEASYVYSSDEAKFKVEFPVQFKEMVNDGTVFQVSCNSSGLMFMASAIKLDWDSEMEKAHEANKELAFQTAINSLVEALNGEIISTVSATKNGVDGKIVVIQQQSTDFKIFYAVYIKGLIEYQLLIMEQEVGSLDDKKVNKFKNSFEIF